MFSVHVITAYYVHVIFTETYSYVSYLVLITTYMIELVLLCQLTWQIQASAGLKECHE